MCEFCVLSTSRGKHEWILPKGGWENDETQQQSAAREAWEEGGVRGLVGRHLVSVDLRHRKTPSTIHFYELSVDEEALAWPERDERTRRWVRTSGDRRASRTAQAWPGMRAPCTV